jgi:hypothetical protein
MLKTARTMASVGFKIPNVEVRGALPKGAAPIVAFQVDLDSSIPYLYTSYDVSCR